MLFGFLLTFFIFICLFLIIFVLIQQSKGSMGIGAMGGGSQMLFGGSGGQDIFQKITWILGALFMGGSLVLSIMKSKYGSSSRYLNKNKMEQVQKKETSSLPSASESK